VVALIPSAFHSLCQEVQLTEPTEPTTPVAGIVELHDSRAVIRVRGYLPSPGDVHVSANQVTRYGLRPGDEVTGVARPIDASRRQQPRTNQRSHRPGSELVQLDTVHGQRPDAMRRRPEFMSLSAVHPRQRLRLETDGPELTGRVIDLVMPVGKGQRALIVAPPKAGKTTVLKIIADAVARNHPDCHLMAVLVDERPEEVTELQRSVKGEIIAATFDRPPQDHIALADLAIERAKRLVELGQDVVVLLDSVTRLARAHNNAASSGGRTLTGGIDSAALQAPKRILGTARDTESAGSLTIIATALVETGSAGDTLFFEEFKSTGNAELRLDRKAADRRVFPAIDLPASGTRREDLLLGPEELAVTQHLRRALAQYPNGSSLDQLLDQLRRTGSNAELLYRLSHRR
jgi:transcription termination factor Rho